jgi:branched-chain amino acid aminotransferase
VSDCFGKYFIHNGKLLPAEHFDNSLVFGGESFYEVVRVKKGLPVFFADHIERLFSGISIAGRPIIADSAALKRNIIELTAAEKHEEINLKIVFNYYGDNRNYLIYYIESVYPTAGQYRHGVKGILFNAERKDPAIKVIDNQLRTAIKHKLIIEKSYEALLVNRNGCITEGSRSNIFFISGNSLVTAPDNSVLGGITRSHLIEICSENGIYIEYKHVCVNEISAYDSVVMTGTSPVILPFCCIDDIVFSVTHPLLDHLRIVYLRKAEESMSKFL